MQKRSIFSIENGFVRESIKNYFDKHLPLEPSKAEVDEFWGKITDVHEFLENLDDEDFEFWINRDNWLQEIEKKLFPIKSLAYARPESEIACKFGRGKIGTYYLRINGEIVAHDTNKTNLKELAETKYANVKWAMVLGKIDCV